MDKMLDVETQNGTVKKRGLDYKTEIRDLLAQMRAIDEYVRQTQAETAQIRAETWPMLDRLKVELNIA